MAIFKSNRIPVFAFAMVLCIGFMGCQSYNNPDSDPDESDLSQVFSQDTPDSPGTPDEMSLYDRLGGLAAISLVVSDFIDVFIQDPLILANDAVKARKTEDSAPYIKYQTTALICQHTGGPCNYTGMEMKEAHDGLNVSEDEWNRMAELLVATLDLHNVPEQEQEELLAIMAPSKDDIVVTAEN